MCRVYVTAAGGQPYAFKNARAIQRERLRTLEALLDEGTRRVLAPRVQPGARCLEIGAGGGSIAAWLCERAGAVVATDLDTTVLSELGRPNLEIRAHDVLADDLPAGAFDLVHLRLVLAWLSDAARAIERLIAALKPGGWLVAEEMDFGSVAPDPHMSDDASAAFTRVAAAHNVALADHHGFDPYYGRRVQGDLADAGLVEVAGEGRAEMWRGGEPGGAIWRLTLTQLRHELDVAPDDVDRVIALTDDPTFSSVSPLVMAAWGRRSR
jgi:SAM-dependent methyltransferase